MSDTGGGHRTAAEAVEAALHRRYPNQFETRFVDVFREYMPFPFSHAPEIYRWWIRMSPWSYGLLFFKLPDLTVRVPPFSGPLPARVGAPVLRQLAADQSPDVLVVLHGVLAGLLQPARRQLDLDIPLVSVVLDVGRPHRAWFLPGADRYLLSDERAVGEAQRAGLPGERLRLIGRPVHPKFAELTVPREEARRRLGWHPDLPAALILGGGDGVGGLGRVARAIDRSRLAVQLAVVCGRNQGLRRRLERFSWRGPVFVYGFVNHLELLMRAADVLVGKSGPTTAFEAATLGLPMIIYRPIPFQETPTAELLVEAGAGAWARRPGQVIETLAGWLGAGGEEWRRRARAARGLARPGAAFAVADEIAALAGAA
ncbi:MAG: MGDG synthase family glycosyltransferase [Candidatus Bipolaricaulaceae bacterium]